MQRVIFAGLFAGAFATDCSPGFTHKADLSKLKCSTDKTTAASCNANCCEADKTTCGGIAPACAGKYKYSQDQATQALKDAAKAEWEARPATAATADAVCCTAKAKCSPSVTCAAGFILDTAKFQPVAQDCTDNAASCKDTCCKKDPTTCSGIEPALDAATCTAAKGLVLDGASDAWKSYKFKAGLDAAGLKDLPAGDGCCSVLPTCSNKLYACKPGFRKKANSDNTFCGGASPSSCASTDGCCEEDPDTCEGISFNCAAGSYYPDTAKANKATVANSQSNCCTGKATCAIAICPAGQKKKKDSDKTFCATDATPASCDAACCEADTEKCGGLTITCAAGFYNPSSGFVTKGADASKYTPQAVMDAWKNLAANETNKNDNCCVAKAQCTNYTSAHIAAGITTTPAPINYATTTPAAALKYSQHKIAVEQASSHGAATNFVYLGLGAMIGMGVLMAVQGVRSRMQAQDARGILLDNSDVE